MGGSPQHNNILVSLNNFLEKKKNCMSKSPNVKNAAAGFRRRRYIKMSKRSRRVLMKNIRSSRSFLGLEGSRRPRNEVEKKVKTLKKLVPNSSDNRGLDGLFSETADYILALEMRVRVMQIMVKVMTTASDI